MVSSLIEMKIGLQQGGQRMRAVTAISTAAPL
jgi:hypothetical protein